MGKLKKILGLDFNDEEYENEYEDEYEDEYEHNVRHNEIKDKRKKHEHKQVIGIHNHPSNMAQVTVIHAKSYSEAPDITMNLRENKIVIVNAIKLDDLSAQRLVDFMSGCSCALDAELQEIEKRVYLLTPVTVQVTREMKAELNKAFSFRS